MDNFLGGQAKAIWDALDTMLKDDPEAYRKFISEQLKEGQQMMQKESQEKKTSEASALGKLFSGMDIGNGPKGQQVKREGSSKDGCLKEDKKKLSGEGDADGRGPLLDDEIGKKSILTQIVKGECDDEENGKLLGELKIPSKMDSKKKITLIEEL